LKRGLSQAVKPSYGVAVLRLVTIVCLLAAVVVAVAATFDHRHKQRVEGTAQVEAWFCAHGRAARCQDFDLEAYEQRWERRELVYETGFFALGASALVLGAAALHRRRKS
jgi:hypothetical protein